MSLLEHTGRSLLAIFCVLLLVPGESLIFAEDAQKPAPADAPAPANASAPAAEAAAKIPPDQLDSLVAPIALYPDPLLAQTLVASTYPLEMMQLQQWMAKNKDLKDKALADAVAKQPWDPSVQSMAATPDVVKRLVDDIQWTTDLGNAFLAQQSDVMDAVQRMRKKAKDKGALESSEQQTVETKTVDDKTVIVVQPSNPEVIYVPSYSPTVVYGPPPYPYPPIYYPPPPPPGAAFVSFSFGVMMGAAIWGGSCCGCGWGGSNNVNINVNNNFNKVNNINGGRGNAGGNWSHNPSHRGGAPYGDKGTANKYGGSSRGDAGGRGQPKTSQQPSRGGGAGAGAGAGAGGAGNKAGPSASNRSAGGSGGGGGDKVGNRSVGGGGGKSGGFGGGGGGFSGSSARASSSRGASSMGSRGGSRGGGGGGRRR